MCVFFVLFSMFSITYQNNASFSNFEGGLFRRQSEYPWYIIEVKSKNFPTVLKNKSEKFCICS
ncbi:Uncharacterized protein FWK35_00030494 [Aphis craccivora]|uniref:Uncharacterized protein n=1 Tax=Aphis craccivora TaxID=307492 RepID=A0A6G0YRA6_APHCR|nr:Uncharacterized protein FWK35_00030494 [Aphis craccivora]